MPQLLAEDYRSIEHFVSPNAFLGHKNVVVTLFVTLGRLDLYIHLYIPICTYIYINVCLYIEFIVAFDFDFFLDFYSVWKYSGLDGSIWGWGERHFMGWPLFLFWHLIYFRYDRQLSFSVFYIYKNVYSRKYFKQMHLHILVVTHENGANVKCGTIYSIASAFPFFLYFIMWERSRTLFSSSSLSSFEFE